jgi:hypothetical protein
MFSFKDFLLLVENRIAGIKDMIKKHEEKNQSKYFDTSFDTHAQHRDTDAIVDHFATHADPTPNKSNTQWILNRYRSGNFRQEDAPRIHSALSEFAKYKGRLDKKDLNQYKGLSDVEDAVAPHAGTFASKGERERVTKTEGADLVHQDSKGLTVHHIKTKEAACLYGKGTMWCTASDKPELGEDRRYEHNMFDHYNKDGPIHVIQTPEGRKYQSHEESSQLMNEKDQPVPPEEFNGLRARHPSLNTFKPLHSFIIQHGSEDEVDAIVDENHPDHKKFFPEK